MTEPANLYAREQQFAVGDTVLWPNTIEAGNIGKVISDFGGGFVRVKWRFSFGVYTEWTGNLLLVLPLRSRDP